MKDFRQAITERVLILDGAMGTLLQERGLPPGGCPEEMNRVAPDAVVGIHAEYANAGADILIANSFGGNRAKLAHYGLADAVDELNRRAVDSKVADSEAREARMLREEARTWLLSDSIDFRRVCQWALLEPEAVRDSARRAVEKCGY